VTPFARWRSRLPATIGSWFARDLVRSALTLSEGGRVALTLVEDVKMTARVRDPRLLVPCEVLVEWGGGTGPLALRLLCSCAADGICEHVVASLETLRSQMEIAPAATADEPDLSWLPVSASSLPVQRRARCLWPVFSSVDGRTLSAALVLDSPRLRGVTRDAQSLIARMETTPADDWDDVDRDLLRDEFVREAFAGRTIPKALARALFGLARHPRLRFDDAPSLGRHPSELPGFVIDMRAPILRAVRRGNTFAPALESAAGRCIDPIGLLLLSGPPDWIADTHGAYLLDTTFDPSKIMEAARALQVGAQDALGRADSAQLSSRTIARVASFLPSAERLALGITDARDLSYELAVGWSGGALVVSVTFVDRLSGARAPYSQGGAVVAEEGRFVRFSQEDAAALRTRLLDVGFVPHASESFIMHGVERAALFVREMLPTWTGVTVRLDPGLAELAAGHAELDVSVAVTRMAPEENWFALDIGVLMAGKREALTQQELDTLLAGSGRFAEVCGKLVDVSRLRARGALLSDLAGHRRSGLAALVALRDEIHENFGDVVLPPEVEILRERLRNFKGIEHVEPPATLAHVLRGYQQRALDFLMYLAAFSFGGVLADDMGLGKSLMAIAYILTRKEREGAAPSLIIAPTSVTHAWENEIARFAPQLSVLCLRSGADRAARYRLIAGYDVIITSYALARLDAERLAEHTFRALILDEAQNAKNPSSQIARVVRALRAQHRLALTGTPVENSLRDLWAIFAFVEPGLLGNERFFKRRFELPIAAQDPGAIAQLRSRLEPFVLRRTKEEVAPELPERTEILLECELSPLQRRLYCGIAEAARKELLPRVAEYGMPGTAMHVLAALTRLRQVCAHPGLLFEEHRTDSQASAKFDMFLETVEEVLSGGHRVLVFSAFSSMLRLMRGVFDERETAYGFLDGTVKDRDRRSTVERFMHKDGPPIFLCSLKAGGVGLTLTAANYVVLYDPWWNPAVERQAIDRTHRIGQRNPVIAYRLVTKGTVEEKIRALAERKAGLSRSIIKADGAFTKALTREDLEMLLADPE
jgi:superfamily II DNA or RNA helicase